MRAFSLTVKVVYYYVIRYHTTAFFTCSSCGCAQPKLHAISTAAVQECHHHTTLHIKYPGFSESVGRIDCSVSKYGVLPPDISVRARVLCLIAKEIEKKCDWSCATPVFIRRYPQFCETMGLTTKAIAGLHPKARPPSWAVKMCEDVLGEMWKAEVETGAGGVKAQRNSRRATAGKLDIRHAIVTQVSTAILISARFLLSA